MESSIETSFIRQGVEELRGIKVALQSLVQFAASGPTPEKALNESECIAWLLELMQTAERLPSLSEIARRTGVNRRQLRADRWPRFRKTYDQLAGLERGVDKSRMVAAHQETEE